jgi:hypothetical protein
MLIRTLPDAIKLPPSPAAAFSSAQCNDSGGDANFFSLCDIIKRFMRAISITSRPALLFLDNIQLSDPVSLGLVHTVLSDRRGALFFVGCYRDNEVTQDHIIHGFQN